MFLKIKKLEETENQPKQQGDNKRSKGKGRHHHNQNQRFKNYEKKDPSVAPIRKFSPFKNFMKFKEALSEKALEDYGP